MTRFFGEIGYSLGMVEEPSDSGVWVDKIIEREYRGDVVRNVRNSLINDDLNPDIIVSNSISIVSDDYATKHSHTIKYVRWAGVYWTVSSIEINRPRLILSIGSVYNGPKA